MAITMTPKIRRHCRILGFTAIIFLFICTVLYTLWAPLSLLPEKPDSLTAINIQIAKAAHPDASLVIPKIIHQTYRNNNVPNQWKQAQKSCQDLHEDYEYKFWTDESADDFIANHYPWFLNTWTGYKHPIQRADALRYFVLVHYGGIYIDLDDGCNYRLDPLLQYPAWLPLTKPIGFSNDVMGSIPQHPFFLKVISSLQAYDRNLLSPYLTVMYSTGPLFLSTVRRDYLRSSTNDRDIKGQLFTLLPADYDRNEESMFRSYQGSSWHEDDAKIIFWMGEHWQMLCFVGALHAAFVVFVAWRAYCKALDWFLRAGRLQKHRV